MTARHIVVLTGAGVSAESGLATFRGAGGLWGGERVEDICTPRALARAPDRVHGFYDARRAALATVQPNAAHRALARLDREWAGTVTLITQNVDDLHARAGTERMIPMHGALRSALCAHCGERRRWNGPLPAGLPCSSCRTGTLRPDVVFFGEMPQRMDEIGAALDRYDLFAAIGTSANVYPAADFVRVAAAAGAWTIEFNLNATPATTAFDEHRRGPATEQVPRWIDELLAGDPTPAASP